MLVVKLGARQGDFTVTMTIADVEKLQQLYPDHKIELHDGAITIMSPSDVTSAIVGGRLLTRLSTWVEPRRLGYVADASAGFRSPEGDLTAPDVSFIARERLSRAPRTYAEVVPNLVAEIKSSTDRIKPLVEKLEAYLKMGAQAGLLIDPDQQTVTIYQNAQTPVVLGNQDTLRLPELLPGWEVAVSDLWPDVFE